MPDTHDIGRLLAHSVQLADDAPLIHRATTAEFDDPCRYSRSFVIKTPFARRGRWHGLRRSWLSFQIKLPTGPKLGTGRWGIVLGWWRYPTDEGWSKLLEAVRSGRKDGDESVNFEEPSSASVRRALRYVAGRRTDAPDGVRSDG